MLFTTSAPHCGQLDGLRLPTLPKTNRSPSMISTGLRFITSSLTLGVFEDLFDRKLWVRGVIAPRRARVSTDACAWCAVNLRRAGGTISADAPKAHVRSVTGLGMLCFCGNAVKVRRNQMRRRVTART